MESSNITDTSQAVQYAIDQMSTYVFSEEQKEYIYSLLGVNPYTQPVSLITIYGQDEVSMRVLDTIHHNRLVLGVVFGVRIGACGLSLITLWIISHRRKTPMFFLNILCLVLLIIHSGLYLQYLLGSYGTMSNYLTQLFLDISYLDMNTSVAANVIQYLIIISVKASLVFQCRVVFADWKLVSNIATGILLLICIPSIGFWTVSTVWNSQEILDAKNNSKLLQYNWVPITAQLFYASIITVSCLVFNAKLFFAIRQRRMLGLKQFGPLQIIFTMGCQTMIIPTVLSFVNYALPESSPYGISALTSMFVVISLPLSSMWASAATVENNVSMMNEINSYSQKDSCQSSINKVNTFYNNNASSDDTLQSNSFKRALSQASYEFKSIFKLHGFNTINSEKELKLPMDNNSSNNKNGNGNENKMAFNRQYKMSPSSGNYLLVSIPPSANTTKQFSSNSPIYYTETILNDYSPTAPTLKESNYEMFLNSPHNSQFSHTPISRPDNPFETSAAREENDRQYAQFMASLANSSVKKGADNI